jgi:uncharacterized cysteine cluster protein YcgN (CxxCxxCC family)
MQFPCKACGECCRHVQGEPRLDRGDGVCRHFDAASRLCQVYAERPVYCNVDQAYTSLFEQAISPTAYYMAQAVSCANLLPDNADMPGRTHAALLAEHVFDPSEEISARSVQRTNEVIALTLRALRVPSD